MYHFSFAPRMTDHSIQIFEYRVPTCSPKQQLAGYISCAGKKKLTQQCPPTTKSPNERNQCEQKHCSLHDQLLLCNLQFYQCPKFQRERKTADIRQTFYIRTIQGTYGQLTMRASLAISVEGTNRTSVVCAARFARR